MSPHLPIFLCIYKKKTWNWLIELCCTRAATPLVYTYWRRFMDLLRKKDKFCLVILNHDQMTRTPDMAPHAIRTGVRTLDHGGFNVHRSLYSADVFRGRQKRKLTTHQLQVRYAFMTRTEQLGQLVRISSNEVV